MNDVKLAGIIAMAGILCQTGKYEVRDMRDVRETRDRQESSSVRVAPVAHLTLLSSAVDAVAGGHDRDAGRRGRGSRLAGGSSRRFLRRGRCRWQSIRRVLP